MPKAHQTLLLELKALLPQKQSLDWYSGKLGVTRENIKELLKEIKDASLGTFHSLEEGVKETDCSKGTIRSTICVNSDPKSVDELYSLHKIDKLRYKIANYWSKQKGDKFTSSVLATSLKADEFYPDQFAEYIKGYESKYIPIGKVPNYRMDGPVDIVISLADLHLDKLDIHIESVSDKKKIYMKILQDLINRASSVYFIDRIVFVIGNDLLHTDTIQGTTTSGTPVESSITWNKAYEEAFDLMVSAITELSTKCEELIVMLVQGNHARTKEYYLAHALELFFKSDDRISFNRDFTNVKHILLGDTFVGFHHGNTKIDDLPLIFATSTMSSSQFGNAKYREVLTGDKHYYLAKEIKGVRVQQMPSLSGTDRWHSDGNFINSIRAGLALVYHQTKGKCAEFEERIPI